MAVSANRLELLQIADAVAREKSIDRMIVIEAMEEAIQRAAKARYGAETEVKAEINPKTGELRLWRLLEVVEEVEDYGRQIALEDARARNEAAKLVMTDQLLDMARKAQENDPDPEDGDVETLIDETDGADADQAN